MTKEERLQELRDQEELHKYFDKFFDAGWREFVKEIRRSNVKSNLRMFNILTKVQGVEFVTDLMQLMRDTGNWHSLLRLTKKPKGIYVKDGRYMTIPGIMMNPQPSTTFKQAEVYIKINDRHWIFFYH